ncbi:MAG: hypothetical protein BWY31_04387 [Lentisphaerae bacterium ADurb.Bin242]|nr:MAG: hypothetical protein BWY31_04387 [Lentisphaerae bacterium ADurb.Bin242]
MASFREKTAVLTPEHPEVWEKTAAQELKHYLERAALSVLAYGKKAVFHVGNTEAAKEAGFPPEKLKEEEWVVRALPDGRVIFCGGGPRGPFYGVCNFLEQRMGVRWFTPTEDFIPEARHFDLTGLAMSGRPFFRIRNIYRRPKPVFDRGRFAARNRLNQDGEWPLISSKYGSGVDFGSPKHCHSIEEGYLPGKQYFRSHPEYYALIDGKRNPDMWTGQICLSNPVLSDLLTEKLKSFILADEARAAKQGRLPPGIYDISLNDSRSFCQCPECAAKVARCGKSGTLLLVLNKVAAELKKFRSEYRLQTLGYFATAEPPRGGIEPLDNIMIRTCNTAAFLHENLLSPANRKFRTQVENWTAHAAMLFPWEYAVTYGASGPLPYPSEFTLADNLRFYAANKSIGIFFEHENPELNDMYDLKVYLEAKLMENPELDIDTVMSDFCTKYYGKASPYILEYRRELRRTAFSNHAKVRYFFPSAEDFRYIDWAAMKKLQGILAAGAGKVKRNPVLRHRLNRACGSLDFALVASLSWYYRVQSEKCGEGELFEQMYDFSRRRLFTAWDKSIRDLDILEKRKVSEKNLAILEFWKKRSAVPMKIRHDLFPGQHEFFAPDCWNVSLRQTVFFRSEAASAGAFWRIFLEPGKEEKIRLAVSQYDISSQTDPVLCFSEYDGTDFREPVFAWFPAGKVALKHDNLTLSVISRHHLNWRFDYLRDLYPGREILLLVELRFNGGKKPSLDVGSVAVRMPGRRD